MCLSGKRRTWVDRVPLLERCTDRLDVVENVIAYEVDDQTIEWVPEVGGVGRQDASLRSSLLGERCVRSLQYWILIAIAQI